MEIEGKFYITVKRPNSIVAEFDKVITWINEEVETPIQVAKAMRKIVTDHPENHGWVSGTTFKPSDYSWAVFQNRDDKTPIYQSENWKE